MSMWREGFVEADGFRIRYCEAGEGPPLVVLHGAGGFWLARGHEMLCARHRVVAFEMPGFGASAENTRTRNAEDLAATIGKAAAALGLGEYSLLGTSFGGLVSLRLALQKPELVSALVLSAPAAIGWAVTPGRRPPSPDEQARRMFAHPERMRHLLPATEPAVLEKQRSFVARVRGPERDAELEGRLKTLQVPTLVLFGTDDRVIPPAMGRIYKELLPNGHLAFVYDAGHAMVAERPEAFAEIVLDFLARRDAFVINRTETVIHP